MAAHMIDLFCILPITARSIFIWFIDDDLNAAALAMALLAALFLCELKLKIERDQSILNK